MLQPFAEGFAEKACQPDEDGFGDSVREAQAFLVRSASIVIVDGSEVSAEAQRLHCHTSA